MKKKILHIIDCLAVGGAEKLLVGTINLLNNFENHLIILHNPETLAAELTGVHRLTNLGAKPGISVVTKVKAVRRYIKDNNIDIVHSHLYWSNIVARLATPENIPLVNTIHAISSEASYKINRLTLFIEKFTYKKRHYIVAVSGEVLKDFDKWVKLKGKSQVIYNRIDDAFFSAGESRKQVDELTRLIAVGNLRWQKNYNYLINSFSRLPAHMKLDVYGEGELREELQQQIDKKGLSIRLCGIKSNMQDVYKEYDAFVMASLYEGMPLSLMEAMACGLPAFLSDVPVLREAGGAACSYFSLTDENDFARKIAEVNEGKVSLKEMSRLSRIQAHNLANKEVHIKKITDLYAGI